MTRIAIIGAGIAGLACARRLHDAGLDVTVLDKSRGIGGRMATRRSGDLAFDHGAQYFTARGDSFRGRVAAWVDRGASAPWHDGRFVGTPGMTAPARALAEGLHVTGSCQVSAIARGKGGWSLATAEGPAEVAGNGSFDTVVLAIPAPQAASLIDPALLPGLATARYAPCWALMLAGEGCVLGQDHLAPDDAAIAWIAQNSAKPGRNAALPALVAHATPQWSRAHLELAPDEAGPRLLAEVRRLVPDLGVPTTLLAHRWRYALVEQAAGAPCLWNAQQRIGACGDWCLGGRVEAAFDSGEAMADRIMAGLAR